MPRISFRSSFFPFSVGGGDGGHRDWCRYSLTVGNHARLNSQSWRTFIRTSHGKVFFDSCSSPSKRTIRSSLAPLSHKPRCNLAVRLYLPCGSLPSTFWPYIICVANQRTGSTFLSEIFDNILQVSPATAAEHLGIQHAIQKSSLVM